MGFHPYNFRVNQTRAVLAGASKICCGAVVVSFAIYDGVDQFQYIQRLSGKTDIDLEQSVVLSGKTDIDLGTNPQDSSRFRRNLCFLSKSLLQV